MSDAKLAAANEALARAHYASKFGSIDARSGSINQQSEYVRAILSRAQEAYRSWASWEAINDQFASPSQAAEAIGWLELNAVGVIRKTLVRDAILGAFALSDPAQPNRLTLCSIASWLDTQSTTLSSREWALDQGHSSAVASAAAETNAKRIKNLRSILVSNWKTASPDNTILADLRKLLRPIRNQLAHASESGTTEHATVEQMRRFIELTLQIATDAAFVWAGNAVESGNFKAFAQEQAHNFWGKAFAEPIRIWKADMEKFSKGGI